MSLFFVSCELAIDGALDGAAKLRQCQFVLPFFCSGEDGLVFFGAKRVSFFSPQIISGASVFVGDGSVGSCCFVHAKGCELPVIPLGGMWIPAVMIPPGGGGCGILLLEFCLLSSFLVVLGLRLEAAGQVKASGVAESRGPTADGWLRRMCCSFPMFGVRPSLRGDDGGGVLLPCVTGEQMGIDCLL